MTGKAIILFILYAILTGTSLMDLEGQKNDQKDKTLSQPKTNSLPDKLKILTNNALKFVLKEEIGRLKINQEGLYEFKGNSEFDIRPPAQTIMALGIALSFDFYEAQTVGIPKIEVEQTFIRLTKSILKAHKANGGNWGNCWQCAHWAFYCGFGAWVSIDLLDTETRGDLEKMVIMEASRFNVDPPYCNDCTVDTKAEENAWNANVLSLAMAVTPEEQHAPWWRERASQWMLSAYARESDLKNDSVVDGKPVKDWISGWNMRPEGYVYNHHRVHPDYTAAALLNLWNPVVLALANQPDLGAAYWNMDIVYKHLVDYKWPSPPYKAPGGTTYRRDSTTLLATVYYPDGTDWTNNLVDNFFMFDILCSILGLDHLVEIPAIKWANVRADYMLWMQSRSNTGQLYIESDSLNFPPKESKAASMFSFAYITLQLGERINANKQKLKWE